MTEKALFEALQLFDLTANLLGPDCEGGAVVGDASGDGRNLFKRFVLVEMQWAESFVVVDSPLLGKGFWRCSEHPR